MKYRLFCLFIIGMLGACKIPTVIRKIESTSVPALFIENNSENKKANSASFTWNTYFNDPRLINLIDTAINQNQELNIVLREIEMTKNEIFSRQGEYQPFINLSSGLTADKAGKYTWDGFSEEDLKENPGRGPKYIGDFNVRAFFSWELDIWKKLRNAKKATVFRYLASIEGKNFLLTNLIAEIASSYYELIGLDSQLEIINKNITIQSNALEVVKLEKESAKVTQLAVNRFEAQLLNTRNLQFNVQQQIIETENRINFLLGRFPQHINRSTGLFDQTSFDLPVEGIPSDLLTNRPDIKQASLVLEALKLDVLSARANFYPSLRISSSLGLQAFNPTHLISPASILYNLGGDVLAPLVNKNAIRATYLNANAQQIQAVYNYERSILNAHIEVVNQLNKISNFTKSYETKKREMEILNNSIDISNNLFRFARADYVEVLLTQREALETNMELIDIKLNQLLAKVNIYKALGGGWR